jgi:dipeptidyl aminopeptidase/acylaminoacyl peptidase
MVVLVAAPSREGRAQAPRALQVEDFYRLRSVGNPSLSPDGRWVAFTVTTPVESTNTNVSEVWLAPASGNTPARRVSAAGSHATNPEWQASTRLRFVAGDRAWSVDPGTPDRLVEAPPVSRTAGRVVRSPDGRWTATLRSAPTPRRERIFSSDFERRHEERFKGVQFDWLDFQRDGQAFPVPNPTDPEVTPPQEIIVARGDSTARPLTSLGLRPAGLQWSGDGSYLVFTADTGYRNERKYGSSEIYRVSLDGNVQQLTANRDYNHSNPQPSPDGRWILYTRQLSTDAVIAQKLDHGGPRDLAIIPAGGGPERLLTADWDYLPTNASWSPDGKHVYFMGGIGGTTHLFRVPVAGGAVQQVTRGERRITGITFDSAYTKIAFTVGLIESPAEVYVANIDGTGERQLSRIHDDFLREVQPSRAERLQFTSRDGTPVEGWLLYPHGYRAERGPYPLVVSNHGGPHSADGYAFDFKSQLFAANGYFVLKVNFRSSTGYGEKFLWATWGAWGDRDGEDVMAGIDYAIGRAAIDRRRVATIGHSYGGFMTNWLITQYPERFAAAIPGAGIVNWVSDYGTADIARTKETEFFGTPWDDRPRAIMIRQSPLTYANRVKAPTLFVHGELDQRVPYSEAEQMYVALKKNGVPTKMIVYAGMAHGITGAWNQVHRMLNELAWLDRYLRTPSS